MSIQRMNLNSLDDYQANLDQIERARRMLDAYQTMNEDAKSKFEYQQELARKIAEGDRARQELEMLRHREALAITAPPPPPSVPPAAPPAHVQTSARIEEIPTHGHAEQATFYPSNIQPHWRVQRQEPTQQHNIYTGTPQYTGDSRFRHYYPEHPTNQPTDQYQSSPAWAAYVRQLSPQHYQQQRPQLPTQAPTPNIRPTRPAAPEARPQTQRMTAPHRDRSQQEAFKSQPNNASSTLSVFPQYSSAAEPVSSSTPETQALYTHETINIRPAAPEARPQTQRVPEPHRDHSQQGAITPVSNPIALSKSQPNNASNMPSGFAHSSISVTTSEPVSSSTPATQKVPYTHKTINVPPAAAEARPQTQRMTGPHRGHPQQGAINLNPVPSSKSQPNNVSSAPSGFASSSSSVATSEPVSYFTPTTQKSDLTKNMLPTQSQAPSSPLTLYKPTSDVHLHAFAANLDIIRYLTASYSTWINNMPLNSYYPISNTQYFVWKRPDNILLLVYPGRTWQDYAYLDIKKLISQPALLPPSSQRENAHPTTPNQAISLSNLPQTKNLQPAQVTATIHTPPPSMGAKAQAMATSPSSQTGNLQAVQTTTPVLTVKSNLSTQSQQRPEIDLHLNKEHAQVLPRRIPADADKRSLARDILRALSLKRPRSPDTPATQRVERPAKRREQEPSAPLPNGAPEIVASDVGDPSPMSPCLSTTLLPAPTTSTEVSTLRSSTLGLPPVRIVESPMEPEPKLSVENVDFSTMEEDLASGAAQSTIVDVDETTDDAANSLNRLTIQEQTVIPAAGGEQVLQAQIEEIEEGEVQVPSEAIKQDGQEDVEEREVQVSSEAPEKDGQEDVEEREAQVPNETPEGEKKEVEEGEVLSEAPEEVEEVEEGEIRMTQLPEGDRRSPTLITPIRKNVEGDAKLVAKTPLFLPSLSPSPPEAGSPEGSRQSRAHSPPDSSILDEDNPMTNGLRDEAVLRRQQHKSHYQQSSHKRDFYILVPPLPSYVRKYKEREARQRKRRKLLAQERDKDGGRARSPSEDITSNPRVQSTVRNSVTRMAERRCRWSGCDTILNSSQNLFEHLKRTHSTPDSSKPYILCSWSGCGDRVRNEQIEKHLKSHSCSSFLCPYAECDESFRSVRALARHTDTEHASDELKSTPDPFSPQVQEPPPIPNKVPDYLIKSGLVRQEPIFRSRHAVLGPWVYNNIAGPVKVTKKYNAAKEKPAEYGFLQSSSMQFSTNPSEPAKIRDLGDLPSGKVSEMISEGLYLWPPQKTPSVVVSSSEDELDGLGIVDNVAAAPIGDKSLVTHQTSEEDAVETMLTYGT